jgi:hypothetical protein
MSVNPIPNFNCRECWHRPVLLHPRIPADDKPRCLYSVKSWLLRPNHRSVRVLQVRGRTQMPAVPSASKHASHRLACWHVETCLGWLVVGGGQLDLPGLSCKFEFTSPISSPHRLHLQC